MTTLVASPQPGGSWASGLGVAEDIYGLCTGIRDGDWVAAGLGAVGTAFGIAAAVMDPVGAALSAGVGWIIDHLHPLKDWLELLTGDSAQVAAFAQTWANISTFMDSQADAVRARLADLEGFKGCFASKYRDHLTGLERQTRLLAGVGTAVSGGFQIASALVSVVYGLVRDAISDIIAKAIVWATETAVTLGFGAPAVVAQAATTVANWAAKIGTKVDALLSSIKGLRTLVDKVETAVLTLDKFTDDLNDAFRSATHLDEVIDPLTGALRRSATDGADDAVLNLLTRGRLADVSHLSANQVDDLLSRVIRSNGNLGRAAGDTVDSLTDVLGVLDLAEALNDAGHTEAAHELWKRFGP